MAATLCKAVAKECVPHQTSFHYKHSVHYVADHNYIFIGLFDCLFAHSIEKQNLLALTKMLRASFQFTIINCQPHSVVGTWLQFIKSYLHIFLSCKNIIFLTIKYFKIFHSKNQLHCFHGNEIIGFSLLLVVSKVNCVCF